MNKIYVIIIFLSCAFHAMAQGQIHRPQKTKDKQSVEISTPDGYINGHGYVDLGLPSGIKWAVNNVGAVKMVDYGHYFAWGELTPKSSYTKENCATYGERIEDFSANPKYDAATKLWGDKWETPSKEVFNELITYCKWRESKILGIKGIIAIGPNGKNIFFPYGGHMTGNENGDEKYNRGRKTGWYWTSTPYKQLGPTYMPEYGDIAFWARFYDNKGNLSAGNYDLCRALGLNIRPISK